MDDLSCCLADFGLASIIETHTPNATPDIGRGTMYWMAPELLDPEPTSTYNAHTKILTDIYAFGCTIFEACAHNSFASLPRSTLQRFLLAYHHSLTKRLQVQ
jgi:serine/threonine protein kinase